MIMSRLPRQLESLARMLTYILSHRPDEFGLVLSEEGFIPIKSLLQALGAEPGWGFVRRYHLDQLAGLMSPPAFEVEGERIRALTPAQLRREPGEPPPALLYAAIPPKAHAKVWEEGLKPLPDRELVLAATPELAKKLGRRRSPDPILVTVQAQAATRRGLSFTGYGEGLYLAPALPRDFLQLPPPPQAPEKPKAGKTPAHGPHPRQLRPGTARDGAACGQTPVQRQEGRAGLEGRDPGPAETAGKRGEDLGEKGEKAKRVRLTGPIGVLGPGQGRR